MQNSLAYATRVRTIKNDVTKMEASKEMIRLKKQVGAAGSACGWTGRHPAYCWRFALVVLSAVAQIIAREMELIARMWHAVSFCCHASKLAEPGTNTTRIITACSWHVGH